MDENKKTDGQKRVDFRRTQLKELSIKARAHRENMVGKALAAGNLQEVERWTMAKVNDIIADWYRDSTGATEFKTFRQWLTAGFAVQRGSKAFVLWSRKRNAKKEVQSDKGEPEEQEYDFFPIAYLFSNLQVEPRNTRPHEETATTQEPAEAAPAYARAEASEFEKAFTA